MYRKVSEDVTLKRKVSNVVSIATMVDVIAHRGGAVQDQVGSSGSL